MPLENDDNESKQQHGVSIIFDRSILPAVTTKNGVIRMGLSVIFGLSQSIVAALMTKISCGSRGGFIGNTNFAMVSCVMNYSSKPIRNPKMPR
jgi:hypothetical protein